MGERIDIRLLSQAEALGYQIYEEYSGVAGSLYCFTFPNGTRSVLFTRLSWLVDALRESLGTLISLADLEA